MVVVVAYAGNCLMKSASLASFLLEGRMGHDRNAEGFNRMTAAASPTSMG